MTEFDASRWANAEFAREYRDNAEVYIIERRRLLAILQSFYINFLNDGRHKAMLDLGCGDGILTHEILKIDKSISVILVDGSEDMLTNARERLNAFKNLHYIRASFQDILENELLGRNFDFVVSSFAIHHLTMDEKQSLFNKIYAYLNPAGFFVNIDVVLSPTDALEQWYLSLWREWIEEKKLSLHIQGNYYDAIARRYKDNTDNKPDTLNDQLNALKSVGFKNIDCFYKYGIFAMYGGKK
ncbi:MAG: class I SAM-dependent methyltransferase [Thermodesulfovibrionales bacterium]|nr:class I SAM-dependent methyltransferase [Thermodesulfovibrionales bacterium]